MRRVPAGRPAAVVLATGGLLLVCLLIVGVGMLLVNRQDRPPDPATSASSSSLLVLTWAPSLCLVETSASGCRSGRVADRGPSLILHGLWPQPKDQRYCGVPERARDRRAPDLPPDLRARLAAMMSDANVLAPHQWYAHGTCSGVTPTEYFGITTTLAGEAIAVLDPIFDRAEGRGLSSRSLRDSVEARLGQGSGSRVSLSCRGGRGAEGIVFEVRLSLPAVTELRGDTPSLADALAGGPPVPPGCGRGRLP